MVKMKLIETRYDGKMIEDANILCGVSNVCVFFSIQRKLNSLKCIFELIKVPSISIEVKKIKRTLFLAIIEVNSERRRKC